jgi:hypothetical protein
VSDLPRCELRLVLAWGGDVRGRAARELASSAVTLEGFAEVRVDPESGTVCWPGGADLAPDTL